MKKKKTKITQWRRIEITVYLDRYIWYCKRKKNTKINWCKWANLVGNWIIGAYEGGGDCNEFHEKMCRKNLLFAGVERKENDECYVGYPHSSLIKPHLLSHLIYPFHHISHFTFILHSSHPLKNIYNLLIFFLL